jgi:hypothetical protein
MPARAGDHYALMNGDAGRLWPRGEALRRAVAWLAGLRNHSPEAIEEACQRYDLSPREEEFLLAEFCRGPGHKREATAMHQHIAATAGLLSRAQVEAFGRQRYVVVPGLFDPAEMAQVRAWADEVAAWPETAGKWMMYFEQSVADPGRRLLNRIENVLPYHAGFRALATGAKMQGTCAQLFGEPAVLFKDKINFKLPGGGGFEAHQDVQAGWSRYAGLHVTALITIDRATVANGCLEMATNYRGQQLIGRDWEPLTADHLAGIDFAPIEAEPGDAVFFDSFVPHRSQANLTDQARRVLYYTYNAASEGDSLARYYADKRASYPPDIEREPGREYRYRV